MSLPTSGHGDPGTLRIEPLDPRDPPIARQLLEVLSLAHAQEARQLRVKNVLPMARTAEDIQASTHFHFGAFSGSALVGAVSIGPDEEEIGQISIDTLVVHPNHQRQGIARRLLQEVLRRGEGRVFSVCTGAANAPALALYRGFGFTVYRHGTLGPDALALVKLRRAPGDAPACDSIAA